MIDQELIKKKAPTAPGVYLFKTSKGEVLYVGKAKNLRKRLQSYLRPDQPYKTRVLLAKAEKLETIVTRSEKEALVLEANLIKKHRPRYNVILRDDKAYPLLRLSLKDEFPRLSVVRRRRKDKALYFGPYPSAGAVRQTLKFLSRFFPLRRCSNAEFRRRERPCLYHQIGRCSAPCVGLITPEEYKKIVDGAVAFLKGKAKELLKSLYQEMEEAAENLEFEKAAALRDRIFAIERTLEAQAVNLPREEDLDVFALASQGDKVSGAVLFVRSGALLGKKTFNLSRVSNENDELYSSLVQQFYDEGKYIPHEILLPCEPSDRELLEEWLSEIAEHKVVIKVPKRGAKKELLDMARQNAKEALAARLAGERPYEELAEKLAIILRFKKIPLRVEGVDISNIQGQLPVGVVVSFWEGQEDKSRYRRYHIKSIEGPDDYAMIYETVLRHLNRRLSENDLPDLILIDGGKGQLQAALAAAEEMGLLKEIDFCALAKERDKEGEKIYLPNRKNPLKLARHTEVLRFLQRVRDEAHRFALSSHQKRRKKATFESLLDQIPGVGPKRKKRLLKHFGSIEKIKSANIEEITSLPGFNRRVAWEIKKILGTGEKI
ncbi:excinuclease ABC, C subunit [Thermodesulfatator indicus DSM 15286]|uniref:UvrABC system protein C n=1 Tax=Thermodesulfatator indicus (strain DSM 15286 / JCM 11887 / CIR29812) TaxID=667014 RepID=F8ABF4_THEID|nr:excinuclease ABC subunit UvrC [Thermodesulfatator indicus]AEH44465.1 excinuclease ABC, C subunit [Thermodesulfatator indicus DSM 15286]